MAEFRNREEGEEWFKPGELDEDADEGGGVFEFVDVVVFLRVESG